MQPISICTWRLLSIIGLDYYLHIAPSVTRWLTVNNDRSAEPKGPGGITLGALNAKSYFVLNLPRQDSRILLPIEEQIA